MSTTLEMDKEYLFEIAPTRKGLYFISARSLLVNTLEKIASDNSMAKHFRLDPTFLACGFSREDACRAVIEIYLRIVVGDRILTTLSPPTVEQAAQGSDEDDDAYEARDAHALDRWQIRWFSRETVCYFPVGQDGRIVCLKLSDDGAIVLFSGENFWGETGTPSKDAARMAALLFENESVPSPSQLEFLKSRVAQREDDDEILI